MSRYRRLAAVVLVFMSWGATLGSAQQRSPWSADQTDPRDLRIVLVTIAPGDELYTWWGHSGIIVEDTRRGISRFYNYGLFSFDEENFFVDFARGRLIFEVGVTPTEPSLAYYRRLNRTVTMQVLALSPQARLGLAEFVENNVLPENRKYLYDHYRDNCATRVRDIVDRFSGGALREASDTPAGTTYREETRRYSGRNLPVDFLLMYLMGSSIDKPILKWDTMFLPERVRQYADQAVIIDEFGNRRSLVAETVEWYNATDRRTVPDTAPPLWPWSAAAGSLLGLLAVVFAAIRRTGGRSLATGRMGYGTIVAMFGFVFGLLGTVLFLMSLFTDHTVTYNNENLIISNPATIALFPLGILAAVRAKPRKRRRRTAALRTVLGVHLVAGVVLFTLKLAGVLNQQNWPEIAAIGGCTAFLFVGALLERRPPDLPTAEMNARSPWQVLASRSRRKYLSMKPERRGKE